MDKRDTFPKNVVEHDGDWFWQADEKRRAAGWGRIPLSDDRRKAVRQAVEFNRRSAEDVRKRELRREVLASVHATRALYALQAETTYSTMSGARFREIREELGLSGDAMARFLRLQGGRTVRKWEAEDRTVPGPVAVLMEALSQSAAVRRYFALPGEIHSASISE
jgi:DNA-binding transcriptional regulator YiaG